MALPNIAKINADMEWEIDEKKKICVVCKMVAKQRCSDCKITYYCSREHQKSDWKSHSTKCRVLKLVEDPKVGRCYVAAREIEAEEVVLYEEKPLLIVPDAIKSAVCLNCYVSLNCDNAKSCDKCGWPLCKDCNVHGPECELTMKYRKSKMAIHDYSRALPIYNAICVLRVLALRDKCPSDYDKLMSMERHCGEMYQDWKDGVRNKSIYEKATIVKIGMKIDDFNVEEIARIIGIREINAIDVWMPYHTRGAIFAKSSYLSHDCDPNCYVMCSMVDNVPTIIIRAVQKIEKGDRVTMTYTKSHQGTEQRRHVLRRTKYFHCTCKRCKDPTELGTMFSAIKCFEEDCKGHMLPSTFIISEIGTLPDYVCDKCDSRKSWMAVEKMMFAIEKEVSEVDQNNVNQLEKFIDKQAKILHENHFHLFEANYKLSMAWAAMIKIDPTCATEEFIEKNIAVWKKLIYLHERLKSCAWGERGTFLIRLFEYTWMLHCKQRRYRESSQSEKLEILQETRKMLHEACRLLRHEPKYSPMAVFAKCAQSLLRKDRSTGFLPSFIWA